MVTHTSILRAMAKRGFITWQAGRYDRHWTGQTVRRVWVSEGPALKHWYDEFTYRGKAYRLRYVDGCFHPFVFSATAQVPTFV